MSVLVRIADDIGRGAAPTSAVRRTDNRAHQGQHDPRRIGGAEDAYARAARADNDDVEVLGLGGRGRPVVSMPSSAFFAQHIGQHPEASDRGLKQSTADGAYRDALDLGVVLERPEPISIAV